MADLLRERPHGPSRLRELLAAGEPVLAPGAYDALSARLIEAAGFDVVYLTGFGTAASRLGRPDIGLLDLSEMVDSVRRIVAAVDVPVVADADTGYGNAINVIRTVQEYERAGVAALHLEDQVAPKRCGHLDGKTVVPVDEFESKVRAAVDARSPDGPLIIARTDARATEGFDATLDRAHRYRAAGADLLFVEALQGVDEIERVARELADVPLLFNWVEGGKTPPIPIEQLVDWGFALVIFPITTLLAATGAIQRTLASIREHRTPIGLLDELPTFDDMATTIGLDEITDLRDRYA
ncbi:MAG: isocitrate lyase/phosphoenolpyruvate mutase family protein [Actinomycetota bacterium]